MNVIIIFLIGLALTSVSAQKIIPGISSNEMNTVGVGSLESLGGLRAVCNALGGKDNRQPFKNTPLNYYSNGYPGYPSTIPTPPTPQFYPNPNYYQPQNFAPEYYPNPMQSYYSGYNQLSSPYPSSYRYQQENSRDDYMNIFGAVKSYRPSGYNGFGDGLESADKLEKDKSMQLPRSYRSEQSSPKQ